MSHPSDVPGIPARSVSARGRGAVAAGATRGGNGAPATFSIRSYFEQRKEMAADINKRVTYLREGYDPVDDVDRQLLREMRGHYGVSKRHAGFRKNDPLMLRGFRRAAYDVFAAAGASGLTREEFHARFPEALAPESRARFDASPDRRKLMWEALSYLRNEGVKLGIIVHGPPLGPWTLIRCEPGFTVIPKKRRRSKPK